MSVRRMILMTLLALAGLLVAVGITTAATELSSQPVGLQSEPLSAGDDLAPAGTSSTETTPREDRPQTTTTETTETDPPATTSTEEPEQDDDSSGSGGDDDSGRGRGRGRGRGGDDD